MSWITGSRGGANTHLTLVTDLMNAATGNGATAASIVNDGTTETYVVGDILTVVGGTSTFPAKLRVTSVSSGAITGIVVAEGGSYTVNPSNPVGHSGGSGAGATFNLTMASNGWTLKRRSVQAASAVVNSGGSGGTNGAQVVTVVGGVGVTTAAQFNVTVSGGAITAVNSVATAGLYERGPNLAPPSLVSTAVQVTGAGLSGATLDVTWAYPTTQEQVMILQGTGGGSDTILVGLRTYSAVNGVNTARNWSLHGFTAYNDNLTFNSQAGISPGDPSTATNTLGAFVPLHDNGASFPIGFWFSVTPNRIVAAFKTENGVVQHYPSLYMGFVNRFGSPSEWPYPILISGCTTRVRALYDSTIITYVSSIVELIGNSSTSGPAWYLRSDGTWSAIANSTVSSDETSPTRSTSGGRVLFPIGEATLSLLPVDSDDNVTDDPASTGVRWVDIAPTDGAPGTAVKFLHPTPDTGGAKRRLYPATVQFALTGPPVERDILGEMDGVFWISAADATTPLVSEDFVTVGTTRYRVFKGGSRALEYTYFAIEEK